MRPIPTPYKRGAIAAVGAVVLFGSGLGIGQAISQNRRPVAIMAATAATPIARLENPSAFLDAEAVTITGKIVEQSEGRIVLQDDSGKAVVALHARGGLAGQLAAGATVSVQGRMGADGLDPSFVVLPGNRVIAIRRHHGGGRHRRNDRDPEDVVFLGRMTVVATALPAPGSAS